MPLIRASQSSDLAAITAIYAHHVEHGTGTFEPESPSTQDMAARHTEVMARSLPWLVAEADDGSGELIGFACANGFKPRPAYLFSAKNSVYVAASACGQGVGRALLSALLQACETAGVRQLLAVIGDSASRASIGLHARAGFEHAGVLRSVGWKNGIRHDVVLVEKPLGAGDRTSPE